MLMYNTGQEKKKKTTGRTGDAERDSGVDGGISAHTVQKSYLIF